MYDITYVYLCNSKSNYRDSTHRLSSQSILNTIIQVLHRSGSQLQVRGLASIILTLAAGIWCGNDLNIWYGRSAKSTTRAIVVVVVVVGKAAALRVTVTAIVTVTVVVIVMMMLNIRTKHLRNAAKYGTISPFVLCISGHDVDV